MANKLTGSLAKDIESYEGDTDFEYEKILLEICRLTLKLDERKITVEELADKLEIRPTAIVRLLKGEHNPTIRFLTEIAGALGCKIKVEFK